MEKHKCKFCMRSFSNGRALGGHMRSHMMNLPKQTESPTPPPPRAPTVQLSFEAESASSLSSYGLRENPKRSFRFTDPNQFIDAGSIILQEDRGSETESSKNPTGPRSKRVKKDNDPVKNSVQNESFSVLSSSSDITTEEEVAFFLISLSREDNNIWKTHTQRHDQQHQDDQYEQQQVEEDEDQEEDEDVEEEEEEEESEAESEEEEEELKPLKKVRGRYKCDTCNKVFRSYQALGGHRASHKKNKQVAESGGDYSISQHHEKINIEKNINVSEKKIHECPICFREFASGQALGGHRRTHNIGFGSASASTSAAAITTMVRRNVKVARVSANVGDSLLDLNFPAPMDEDEDEHEDNGDDDVSQVEGSAVSDAEFVKPH